MPEPSDEIIQPPEWFTANVSAPCRSSVVEVDACAVHYLSWGDPARPGLVFVHGGAASAEWFRFLAPFFTDTHHVAALDLSGMGESGRRERYGASVFVGDVEAVLTDAGMMAGPVPPTIVGHSMGGMVTGGLAQRIGAQLLGIIVCDVGRMAHRTGQVPQNWSMPPTENKYYPSRAAALARYRLAPAQPCRNRYIVDYLARRSVIEREQGWTFKFDARVFMFERDGDDDDERQPDLTYAGIACPSAMIYGEKSHLYSDAVVELMRADLGRRAPLVVIPDAHHHLFIDQPLAFTAAVQAITRMWLGEWASD